MYLHYFNYFLFVCVYLFALRIFLAGLKGICATLNVERGGTKDEVMRPADGLPSQAGRPGTTRPQVKEK